jgi:hypothetical protein
MRSAGIEPAFQASEACVLSVAPRARETNATFILYDMYFNFASKDRFKISPNGYHGIGKVVEQI